jgi:hypothetical protein
MVTLVLVATSSFLRQGFDMEGSLFSARDDIEAAGLVAEGYHWVDAIFNIGLVLIKVCSQAATVTGVDNLSTGTLEVQIFSLDSLVSYR